MGCLGSSVVRASAYNYIKQCVVGSNPTQAAFFSFWRKKELFGLVVLPFLYLYIGLRVSMHTVKHVMQLILLIIIIIDSENMS